ncbi:hypothetical protein EVA_15489 [gut metagenome]|uniref:Uncharacterized protein n=1 Tax=gut metagenome TaxID=749906 RepID=J9FPK6_9ZZZZ
MVRVVDVIRDVDGLSFGENGRAGIALLLSGIPVLSVIAQVNVSLVRLHLCLLQAAAVRRLCGQKVQKSLLYASTQAVHVPGNQLHRCSPPRQIV